MNIKVAAFTVSQKSRNILMNSQLHINAIRMGLSIGYLKGHRLKFPHYNVCMSLKIGLTLANSNDPDEMQHYAAFHPGLHSIRKNRFRGFQCTKG